MFPHYCTVIYCCCAFVVSSEIWCLIILDSFYLMTVVLHSDLIVTVDPWPSLRACCRPCIVPLICSLIVSIPYSWPGDLFLGIVILDDDVIRWRRATLILLLWYHCDGDLLCDTSRAADLFVIVHYLTLWKWNPRWKFPSVYDDGIYDIWNLTGIIELLLLLLLWWSRCCICSVLPRYSDIYNPLSDLLALFCCDIDPLSFWCWWSSLLTDLLYIVWWHSR